MHQQSVKFLVLGIAKGGLYAVLQTSSILGRWESLKVACVTVDLHKLSHVLVPQFHLVDSYLMVK